LSKDCDRCGIGIVRECNIGSYISITSYSVLFSMYNIAHEEERASNWNYEYYWYILFLKVCRDYRFPTPSDKCLSPCRYSFAVQ
jgi:hypothetical protein